MVGLRRISAKPWEIAPKPRSPICRPPVGPGAQSPQTPLRGGYKRTLARTPDREQPSQWTLPSKLPFPAHSPSKASLPSACSLLPQPSQCILPSELGFPAHSLFNSSLPFCAKRCSRDKHNFDLDLISSVLCEISETWPVCSLSNYATSPVVTSSQSASRGRRQEA